MAGKSILDGRASQVYSSCLADGCEEPARKMTSFSGLGELRVVPKPNKDAKAAPASREPYDPHTIHFAPLCRKHAERAGSKGARSVNLTKKVAETWRQGEANISAIEPADVPLNPRKKREPRMTFMSGKATGPYDPIQDYINYNINTAKTKEQRDEFSSMSHARQVSARRSEHWKDRALSKGLERIRKPDVEKENLLKEHLSAIKEDNEKYLKDTGLTTEKGNWNVRSSEENPFFASHMRRTTRDYYFRPSKDPNREIVPHKPPKPKYVSSRAKSAGPQKSGDVILTGRQAAMERSLEPRLENIEKEYQQKKQARIAGKQFNKPATVIVTPGK